MSKFRFRRRAVSNIVGGIIVLSLFIIGLTAMVVVNQQYDAYETLTGKMSQKDIDRASESMVDVYPGLAGAFPAKCGVGCTLNQYNMTLANEGGVGVQIARIYINSTQQTSGCTISPNPAHTPVGQCILSPINSVTSFGFAQGDSYVTAGEFNHIVRLWLPQGIVLPNVTFTPSNSIWIVTTRGRVFSFSWPIPPAGQATGGAGTPLNLSTGSMKIAYNGTHSSQSDTCHQETPDPLPAGGTSPLYFVNPWITPTVLGATTPPSSPSCPNTGQCLFISVYSENTRNSPISFSWGQLIILTAQSTQNAKQYYIGGDYVGIVTTSDNTFHGYGTLVTVQPGQTFYLIFDVVQINYTPPSLPASGDLFTGTATVNNGFSTQNEGSSFQSFLIFLDGLYVRNNGGTGC